MGDRLLAMTSGKLPEMDVLRLPLSVLSQAAPRAGTPLWRLLFDAVERPLAAASESWIQTDAFMDALAVSYRVQRRLTSQVERGLHGWLGACGIPTRGDVVALVNQVASLERKVRELERELERGA
jgi:hypothetical protein